MTESSSTSTNPGIPAVAWIAGIAIAAGVAAYLFGVPYSFGYGGARVNMAWTLQNFWKMSEWQHCWFVPLISFFVIWQRRRELAVTRVSGHWSGFFAIAASAFFFWAGYRTDNFFVGLGGVWIFIGGAVVAFLGWGWMRLLLFPWAFLFFAMPLVFLEELIAFRLRLVMSNASAGLLNFFGVDAFQQGTAILSSPKPQLGIPAGAVFSVDVADPCSGIRSLFALTMGTALYAFFMIKPVWKQLALFACSIPLAIAGNMARILILTAGTIAFGAEFAIGSLEEPTTFHMAAGFAVFIVALLGMVGIGQLLMTDWPTTIQRVSALTRRTLSAKSESQPEGTHEAAGSSLQKDDVY